MIAQESGSDIVGSGFAVQVNKWGVQPLSLMAGEPRIKQSIRIILDTEPGERVMRPDFGCHIWRFVFAPLDLATLGAIEDAVSDALGRWEPRIEIERVAAEFDDQQTTLVHISIDYRVRTTNDQRNLVHPFYVIPGETA